jgi:hypothetical protein
VICWCSPRQIYIEIPLLSVTRLPLVDFGWF